MIGVLSAAYLIYSLYITDPLISGSGFQKSLVEQAITLNQAFCEEVTNDRELWLTNAQAENFKEALINLGYLARESENNELDVRNAVLSFQSDHNLQVDGIWGEQSSGALIRRVLNSPFNYNDIVEEPPTDKRWITVNKTKRLLTVYEGKTVVKKYPVAIGNPSVLTPTGKFKIVYKTINPAWGGGGYAKPVVGGSPENPLGYRWMGLSIGNGDRYGIHGNNSPFSIGRDISHGCIRMLNADVEILFENTETATPVWIGTEDELKEWKIIQGEN